MQLGLCNPPASSGGIEASSTIIATAPKFFTSPLVANDGVTHTMVLISGGAFTTPITMSEATPTQLSPDGPEIKSSLLSVSSEVAGVVPLATDWANAPDSTKASSAVQSIMTLIPEVGGLTSSLGGGDAILNRCEATGDGLVFGLNDLMCCLIDMLNDLEHARNTTDPAILGPLAQGVLSDAGKLSSIASNIGSIPSTATATATKTSLGMSSSTTSSTNLGAGPITASITSSSIMSSIITSRSTSSTTASTMEPFTVVTLPAGATLVPLPEYTAPTPIYITTTSPGRTEQTIVPGAHIHAKRKQCKILSMLTQFIVIIPVSGPPEICFGCYTTFPPNIQIDVSGSFCIQLFGTKIGNCPEDGKDSSPNPSEPDEPSNPDPDDPSNPDPKPTEPKTESEACRETLTATYESIFCTVVGTAQQVPTACSTQAYSVVTGCTITASTTSTTTTVTAEPSHLYCSPGSCGTGECHTKRSMNVHDSQARVAKRGDPDEGDWVDRSDYADQTLFVAGEVYEAYTDDIRTDNNIIPVPKLTDNDPSMTTSQVIQFNDKVISLSVQGLYGCTSVVVVSRRGAWISHIWEVPTFTGSIDDFRARGLEYITWGLRDDNPQFSQHKYGLKNLRGNTDRAGNLGKIFGVDNDDIPGTRAYILAPRPRVWVQEIVDEHDKIVDLVNTVGEHISDEKIQDPNAMAGTTQFPGHNDQITQTVKSILGESVPVQIIEYSPNVLGLEDRKKDLSPEEIAHILGDNDVRKSRGKLYLQYRPARCDRRQASWRLWIEDRMDLAGRTDSWDAEDGQMFVASPKGKRDGGSACTLPTGPSTSASVTTTVDGHTVVVGPSGTSTVNAPIGSKTPGSCTSDTVDKDCGGPSLSCTGGLVARCEQGRCVCRLPEFAPGSKCITTDDCRPISLCDPVTQFDACENSLCVCKPAPTSTRAPEPSTASTRAPEPTTTSTRAPELSSTTTAAAPAPTKTEVAPRPSPTEAVIIGYQATLIGSEFGVDMLNQWVLYPQNVKESSVSPNLCVLNDIGSRLDDSYPSGADDIPWPGSVSSAGDVFGHKGCHYIGSDSGAGRFACDDVNEFACVVDSRNGQEDVCELGTATKCYPKIQCLFPA
ncbi:hypothetical protein JX266_003229 [Neoarthrinium moseri]|nr:hypothetical protein JX266_003229 [Neoarthrinium moseri]